MRKFIPLLLLLAACTQGSRPPEQIEGWAPIYRSFEAVNSVSMDSARATGTAGKIYAYGNYIFQVDQYQGIHVIDNTNPSQAKKIGFLNIPFCTEISIKNGLLYTNSHTDLLAVDISDIMHPQLRQTLKGAFPSVTQDYPQAFGYFECVDPSKGIVVGWEKKTLNNPKCHR